MVFQVLQNLASPTDWCYVILPRQTTPPLLLFLPKHISSPLPFFFSLNFLQKTLNSQLIMSQNILTENDQVAESPRPLLPDRQESIHPGLRPSLLNVPVTPGIHLGEYDSEPRGPDEPSYFVHDIHRLRETMAQSPSAAASGAKSNHEILQRMSLNAGQERRDSLADIDPRAANPALNLSGGVISATFCIPHSLKYRKGQDWVS